MYEIEKVMNHRPLTEVGDSKVITPAHILFGSAVKMDDVFSSINSDGIIANALRARNELPEVYARGQKKLDKFWKALQQQYLHSLRFTRDKMRNNYLKTPKIDDIVILHTSDPRNKWKMARVVKLIPSEDGEIRECAVICKDVVMTRAVNHLYPLEINVEDGFEETRLIKQRMIERKALAETQERHRLANAPAEHPPLREATEVLATTQETLQSPTRSQQAEVNEIRELGPAAEVGVSQAIHNSAPQIVQGTLLTYCKG